MIYKIAKFLYKSMLEFKNHRNFIPTNVYHLYASSKQIKYCENDFNINYFLSRRLDALPEKIQFNCHTLLLDLTLFKHLILNRKSKAMGCEYILIEAGSISFSYVLKAVETRDVFYLGHYKNAKRKKFYAFRNRKNFSKSRGLKNRARLFLPKDHSEISEFIEFINEHTCYVVLRWWEDIYSILSYTEDIDLLVSDDDFDKIKKYLKDKIGEYPIDIYSVSGQQGGYGEFKIPYFPVQNAKEVLNNRVLYSKGGYYIPSVSDYRCSFLYHILYQKGEKSELKNKYSLSPEYPSDHDYEKILNREKIISGNVTLETVEDYLVKHNWVPKIDVQYKLSYDNQWLTKKLEEYEKKIDHAMTGLLVYIVREEVFLSGLIDKAIELLDESYMPIIFHKVFSGKEKKIVAENVRGGNWEKGPFPVSGGLPYSIIVAYDEFPQDVDENSSLKKSHPFLSNEHIYFYKHRFRGLINRTLAKDGQFNGFHSPDNSLETEEMLRICCPERSKDIESFLKQYSNNGSIYPIIKDLSNFKRRAKIELIEYKGKKAIKKTFKNNALGFLKNEIDGLGFLKDSSIVPSVFEIGSNYIIMEYFDGISLDQIKRKLSYGEIVQLRKFLFILYSNNYTMVDVNPSGVILSDGVLKIIDFEFFQSFNYLEEKIKFKNLLEFKALNSISLLKPTGNKEIDRYYSRWESLTKIRKKHFFSKHLYLIMLFRVEFSIFKIFRSIYRKFKKLLKWIILKRDIKKSV